jgi:hypothetical protein
MVVPVRKVFLIGLDCAAGSGTIKIHHIGKIRHMGGDLAERAMANSGVGGLRNG